jgi:hypothetical protein
VFADNGIKFFDLHLFRHCPFVLCRCVKVAGSFGRNQFNFVAHFCILLTVVAGFTQIGKNGINAFLVNDTHAFGGNSEANPAVFALYPESVVLQIRTKASFSSVISV